MKRTVTTAALATSVTHAARGYPLASLSAALGAESTHRYRVVSRPTQRVEVRVAGSGSTWFTGTDTHGEKVTVVFPARFATIVREGTRVPVSYLKAGETVQVEGRIAKRRFAATSARLTQPSITTASATEAL